MKTAMKNFFLATMLLMPALAALASQRSATHETVRVVEIISNTEIKTLGPAGRRQQLRLAGIKPVENKHPANQSGKKRLQSLVLGKTVRLEKISGNKALVNYGGLDVSVRLLEEGLAVVNMQDIQAMPMHKQQQLISAEENAVQNRRGYWFRQKQRPVERFHYPQWPAQGLPMPMTNAPVYVPQSRP